MLLISFLVATIFLVILPVYLAILSHKKRENKFAAIEAKCSEIISISNKIINCLNNYKQKKEEKS